MRKFWIATDKEGNCNIFNEKPERTTINIWGSSGNYQYLSPNLCIMLIGRELTWEDEPVKIEINIVI